MGQIRTWYRQGRIRRVDRGPGRAGYYSAREGREVAEWARRAMSEQQVQDLLRLRPPAIRGLAVAGELGEHRAYAGFREYDRGAVERYAAKRARLISMRTARGRYSLPWWLVADFV